MPGSPPTSTAEPGDEAAAEHAVELGDAGLAARGGVEPARSASLFEGGSSAFSASDGAERRGPREGRRLSVMGPTRRSPRILPDHRDVTAPQLGRRRL